MAASLGVSPVDLEPAYACAECGRAGDGAHGRPGYRLRGRAVPVGVSYAREGSLLLVALGHRDGQQLAVGVDVQDSSGFDARLDSVMLTPHEAGLVGAAPPAGRDGLRARLWTRKEAVLKASGHGLRVAPSDVGVGTAHRPALGEWPGGVPHPGPVRIHDLPADQLGLPPTIAAALAVISDDPVEVCYPLRTASGHGGRRRL